MFQLLNRMKRCTECLVRRHRCVISTRVAVTALPRCFRPIVVHAVQVSWEAQYIGIQDQH